MGLKDTEFLRQQATQNATILIPIVWRQSQVNSVIILGEIQDIACRVEYVLDIDICLYI